MQTTLFGLSKMQCQRRLQISRVKNIANIFELSGVTFRLASPYDGLLVGKEVALDGKVQNIPD